MKYIVIFGVCFAVSAVIGYAVSYWAGRRYGGGDR